MYIPAEQISEDDVIIRQQQADRDRHLTDMQPASFKEYLSRMNEKPATPRDRHRMAVASLCELAEKARRAPRDG